MAIKNVLIIVFLIFVVALGIYVYTVRMTDNPDVQCCHYVEVPNPYGNYLKMEPRECVYISQDTVCDEYTLTSTMNRQNSANASRNE